MLIALYMARWLALLVGCTEASPRIAFRPDQFGIQIQLGGDDAFHFRIGLDQCLTQGLARNAQFARHAAERDAAQPQLEFDPFAPLQPVRGDMFAVHAVQNIANLRDMSTAMMAAGVSALGVAPLGARI